MTAPPVQPAPWQGTAGRIGRGNVSLCSTTSTRELPTFLREMLDNPPRAGAGVHNWLFRVARQLHTHMPAVEIVSLLEHCIRNCGRHVPKREIVDAVQNALACAWMPRGSAFTCRSPAAKWPSLNPALRAQVLSEFQYGLADLWEFSPVRIETGVTQTEPIIDHLFPGNPLLCCGQSSHQFATRPREAWRGELAQQQFIVPSPMTATTGTTKNGDVSAHALDNTGPRRYLVCEFDADTHDEQASILLHLAEKAPLAIALWSGGKSLHGWFYVENTLEDKVLRFFRYALSLGADHATWNRTQFVRMPDGTRADGNRQSVFFFHPQVVKGSV